LHPEPLTDPDVSLSAYSARATQWRLPPSADVPGSSGCPLTRIDAGDLPPSLPGHSPGSSLLRSSPPLAAASRLSASWVRHLGLFSSHRQRGSQVPCESPDGSHVAFAPDTVWPVRRWLPHLSRSRTSTPVSMSSLMFRCVIRDSLPLVSPIPT